MGRHGRALAEGVGLFLLGVLLFLYPDESAQGAREGVTLCLDLLIPSLFPFFVLSSLLISTGLAGLCAWPLEGLMRPLCGVGGAGATAFSLGLIGGYPVGARTIAQLVERRECTREEANRLALFCNNCGPAFFVGAAGVGVFGAKEAGFLLLGANFAAALLLGLGMRWMRGPSGRKGSAGGSKPVLSPLAAEFPDCVRGAFSSTLGVCAYVILFSVLAALADCSGVLPFCADTLSGLLPGEHAQALCRSFFIGLMELSTGAASLGEAAGSPVALPLAAFILGWGGLSVHCQSLPFWRAAGVRAGPYLRAKLAQGILSAALTALALRWFPLSLPVMAPRLTMVSPCLLGRELLALWGAAGVYFFLLHPKKSGKDKKERL